MKTSQWWFMIALLAFIDADICMNGDRIRPAMAMAFLGLFACVAAVVSSFKEDQ